MEKYIQIVWTSIHKRLTLYIDYYITEQKQTCTCTNARETTTLNVTTADIQKLTFTYLYNVLE